MGVDLSGSLSSPSSVPRSWRTESGLTSLLTYAVVNVLSSSEGDPSLYEHSFVAVWSSSLIFLNSAQTVFASFLAATFNIVKVEHYDAMHTSHCR